VPTSTHHVLAALCADWSQALLEALVAAPASDDQGAVCRGPGHGAAREVHYQRRRLAGREPMRRTPGVRSRPAIRAPLLKPCRAVAHRRPSGTGGIPAQGATSSSAPVRPPPVGGRQAAGARRVGGTGSPRRGDRGPTAFLSRDRVFLTEIPESPCKRDALRDELGVLLRLQVPAIQPDCRDFRRVSEGTRTPDRLDHNQELYQLSYAHRGTAESTSVARERRVEHPRQDSNLRPSA
jgi:hypothetical protein